MSEIESKIAGASTLQELATFVHEAIGATGVLVTKVTKDTQYILANEGIELPAHLAESMPISHSICQHSSSMDFPLVIDSTKEHSLLVDNLAYSELNVRAYLGAPVHCCESKTATGAICALHTEQRRWNEEEIAMVTFAARVCDKLMEETT